MFHILLVLTPNINTSTDFVSKSGANINVDLSAICYLKTVEELSRLGIVGIHQVN